MPVSYSSHVFRIRRGFPCLTIGHERCRDREEDGKIKQVKHRKAEPGLIPLFCVFRRNPSLSELNISTPDSEVAYFFSGTTRSSFTA